MINLFKLLVGCRGRISLLDPSRVGLFGASQDNMNTGFSCQCKTGSFVGQGYIARFRMTP